MESPSLGAKGPRAQICGGRGRGGRGDGGAEPRWAGRWWGRSRGGRGRGGRCLPAVPSLQSLSRPSGISGLSSETSRYPFPLLTRLTENGPCTVSAPHSGSGGADGDFASAEQLLRSSSSLPDPAPPAPQGPGWSPALCRAEGRVGAVRRGPGAEVVPRSPQVARRTAPYSCPRPKKRRTQHDSRASSDRPWNGGHLCDSVSIPLLEIFKLDANE